MANQSLPKVRYSKQPCLIEGCDELTYTRNSHGWCCKHLRRWQRWGDPLKTLRQRKKPIHIRRCRDPEERFWARVDRSPGQGPKGDCWEWTAGRASDFGYGSVWYNGRNERAHRLSFFFANGEWPKHFACHICDNPPCVNPDHLFDGTFQENMDDMVQKGRAVRGVTHPNAMLTADIVLSMRKLKKAGESTKTIARQFGVRDQLVRNVVARRCWQHVE